MASIFQNIGDVWNRAPLIHRVMLLGILLALLVAGGGLIYWSTQPSLALLYAGLAPEEAASIVEKVRDQDIPYDLKDGGTSVYVPQEEVYSVRLMLAAEGMPVGQTQAGYEVLKDQPIGQSPAVQRINIIRATEGELAKTIQTLNGVSTCRVHVVRPEAVIFTGRRDEATATVVVKTRSGYRLSGSNVAAIVHLVSGAVESLRPEKVVVIDANNNMPLTGGENDQARGAMATRKMQVEQELARKAEAVLTQVLGAGRAKVEVSVELTNEDTLTVSRQYESKGTPSREEIVSEIETGGGSSSGDSRKSENIITEYDTGMTFTERTVKAGEIKSRNVAAVVDLYPAQDEGDAEDDAGELLMTEEQVRGLITDAVGLTESDSLTIVNQRFFSDGSGDVEPLAEGGMFSKDFLLEMGKRISLGLLVVGALLALKMFGGAGPKTAKPAGQAALPGEVTDETERVGARPQLDPDLLRTQITHALEDNPDEVKQLFLSWVESQN